MNEGRRFAGNYGGNGMRFRNTVILLSICIMEAALGLGIMSIYAMHFKLPIDGCTSLQVAGHSYFIGEEEQMDEAYGRFINSLSDFAEEDGSLLILCPFGAAGLAVHDDGNWLQTVLISGDIADFSAEKGIIVSSDPTVQCYIGDGVFMRGKFDLSIIGVYDENKMPMNLRNMGFICPLGMAAKRPGLSEDNSLIIMTNTKDTDGLIGMIESSGYREKYGVSMISEPIGLIEGVKKSFMHDDPFSADPRPTAFGVLSLMTAIVCGGLILCRDNLNQLNVRRLFGMPCSRMIALLAGVSVLTVIFGLLLFYGIASASKAFWFYEQKHILRLIASIAAILCALALAVDACGIILLRSFFRGGKAK